MLGRYITTIVNKNVALKQRVISILQQQLQGFTQEEINQMYNVRSAGDNQVRRFKLIAEVVKGIND